MIENTMNRRLFPVFHAANATMTRTTTKITPPAVTSTGRPDKTAVSTDFYRHSAFSNSGNWRAVELRHHQQDDQHDEYQRGNGAGAGELRLSEAASEKR
jgi:hypothetical protein